MRALVGRVQAGSVSREDWSNLAALTLVWQGDPVILAIAGGGFDTFVATSAPLYAGHGFHHDDYRRMYTRICDAATRYTRDRVVP
jgi:hypothetical protein